MVTSHGSVIGHFNNCWVLSNFIYFAMERLLLAYVLCTAHGSEEIAVTVQNAPHRKDVGALGGIRHDILYKQNIISI